MSQFDRREKSLIAVGENSEKTALTFGYTFPVQLCFFWYDIPRKKISPNNCSLKVYKQKMPGKLDFLK
jgi:hypothetical protein